MSELMHYLPPLQQQPQPQSSGADKYHGAIAQNYDEKRQKSAKWRVEQRIIEDMLSDLEPGSWIFDAPCGTGRFLPFCVERNFIYRGLDKTDDMLKLAMDKIDHQTPILKFDVKGQIEDVPQFAFQQGDVLSSGVPDKAVDVALNVRITRWLSPDQCQQMFKEMQRISRDRIILTARVCNHEHARTLALFEEVMSQEWHLVRSEAGALGPADAPVEDPAYRIFMFQRKDKELATKTADDSWTMDPFEAA